MAFFSAALTHFKGVAELGIMAGGGVVLCMLAALFVLPALLHVTQRRTAGRAAATSLPIARLCEPFCRHAVVVLVIAGVVTGVLSSGLSRLRYDHNLLNLQPLHLESVEMERKLAENANRSVWYGLSIADTPAQLAQRKARFESLEVVAHTEEIASLLPAPDEEKEQLIARVRSRLDRLPDRPPLIPVTPPAELLTVLQHLPVEAVAGPFAQQLARLPDQEYYRRLSRFQQRMAEELLGLLQRIRELAEPNPPQRGDVPPELLERYVGRSGKHLLKVYGQGSIWDMEALERFVKGVESVDPRITGHPVQTYYASREMQSSYVHAAIYSLLSIAIILILDFRSVRYTLLAMVPLFLGVVQLFGLLGLLDIPLNAANLIVLPLVLGIGIDNGVHIVHEFLEQKGVYRLSNSTACAILLCAVTTMIGFGSMVFSRHQGLRSLGQVLTLGVFCCLVSSLVVLPPLLVCLRPASQPNEEVLK